MRVLAIQLKRIGDLLLTLPALRALKEAGAHVTLALNSGAAELLPAMTDSVDDAVVYRSRKLNGAVWTKVLSDRFDACIDLTGRERSALMALASRGAQRVISRDALRGKGSWRRHCYNTLIEASVRNLHTVDYHLAHLVPLGIQAAAAGPTLHLPPGAIERARAACGVEPGEYAVIHPGSARREKYWEPEHWAKVINFCQGELELPCVLTGGRGDPYEDQHLAAIRARLDQPCVDLAGKLDLLTLAAVVADARLFAGVDSGPMHLAAAWETPQVVLFGPTNPFHWRPRHADCLVLRSGFNAPLAEADFRQHGPGGPMEGVSTAAVIGCIRQLAQRTIAPRITG